MVVRYQQYLKFFSCNFFNFFVICLSNFVNFKMSSYVYAPFFLTLIGLVTLTRGKKFKQNFNFFNKIILTLSPMLAFYNLGNFLKNYDENYLSVLNSAEILFRSSFFSIFEITTLLDEALLSLFPIIMTGFDFGFSSAKFISCILTNVSLVLFFSLNKSINSLTRINKKLTQNIFEKINSGLMRISKGKIVYVSKVLRNNIVKIYPIYEHLKLWEAKKTNENKNNYKFLNFFYENSELILETLLNMNYLSEVSKLTKNEISFYSKVEYFLEEEKVYYDVFAQPTSDSEVDLIFNETTKEILIENKIKEGKHFSELHSKIAHEFKNSLISISELIDRIKNCTKGHLEAQMITQIKSMCSYMLIVVKDLAIFKVDYEKNLTVEKNECKLDETINLCEEVARVMLNKQCKDSRVIFESGLNKNVPDIIYTDETKLRQILLNLISNAVKFTSYGVVSLHVITQGSDVVFKVRDSGVGMKNKYEEFINKGTGLKICQILTKKIGKEIKCESALGEGTTFTFSIPQDSLKVKNSDNFLIFDKLVDTRRGSNLVDRRNSIVSAQTVIINNLVLVSPVKRMISDMTINNSQRDLSNISKLQLQDNESSSSSTFSDDEDSSLPSLEIIHENMKLNILIVDDEPLVRSSTRKIVEQTAKNLGININVIEAKDGVETLYLIYKYHSKGLRIAFILSDENMIFMQGSKSAEIINKIYSHLIKVPDFYIVSSYEDSFGSYNQTYIKNVYSKPLKKNVVESMLKQYG